jgi:hypothetical protein
MKIIEVSQFVDTNKLEEKNFKEIESAILDETSGINKDWLRSYYLRDVKEDASPIIGYVWLKEGENGLCKVFAYNYDSSD